MKKNIFAYFAPLANFRNKKKIRAIRLIRVQKNQFVFNTKSLHQYFKQHPHYISNFLKDICLVWWWRIRRQPLVVITSESGGLGDYLWFRSYYNAIREHYSPKQCRIVVVGMRQWEPLALGLDNDKQSNHFDIYRSFESPDHYLKIESLFFRLFKANVYLNFRARHLKYLVKAKECYFGLGFRDSKQYYELANNSVINQCFPLPDKFKHVPPLLPIADKKRDEALNKPFVVVVEGGNTQGKLSKEQIQTIIKAVISQGYNIFFNGDYKKLSTNLTLDIKHQTSDIIDGYTYPLKEYPTVVSKCQYVVTVNTFVYHLAIQLEKPCVVLSANEYESIKLDAPKQIILFNNELQQAYKTHTLDDYTPIPSVSLQDIDCERIVNAISEIAKKN